MKTLIAILVLFAATLGSVDAQTAIELKNAGNAALKEKKYGNALASYESALAEWGEDEEPDLAMIYNTGVCAYRTKDFRKADKYFNMSIESGYKAETAYRYKANSLKQLGDSEGFMNTLYEGLDKYPNSKEIRSMLSKHYLKEGNVVYKKGAAVLKLASDDIGAGKYTTNDEAYKTELRKAKEEFKSALILFDKALEHKPTDATALKLKEACEKNLKM